MYAILNATALRQQLVNGMHTTLAFMTLRERREVGEGEELMLIKPNEVDEELEEDDDELGGALLGVRSLSGSSRIRRAGRAMFGP